jgi:probable rRNA maturation factor
MQIEIVNLTKFRIDKKYFQKIGEFILEKLKQSKDVEISLVFAGDARMRALNKKYRRKDKTTDVLSFSYQNKINPPQPSFAKGGSPPPFFYKGKPEEIFGEIVISIPQAKKQARQRGYPLKRELSELFTHGILHLAGYDDEKEKDCDVMIEKQEEILAHLSTK